MESSVIFGVIFISGMIVAISRTLDAIGDQLNRIATALEKLSKERE